MIQAALKLISDRDNCGGVKLNVQKIKFIRALILFYFILKTNISNKDNMMCGRMRGFTGFNWKNE
jgi:hypothetical protein